MAKTTKTAAQSVTVTVNLEELEAFVQRVVDAALEGKAIPAIEKEDVEAPAKATKGSKAPAKSSKAKKAEAVEEVDEDDDSEDEEEDIEAEAGSRRDELEEMDVKALRKIAINLGFDKADVKEADKETLVESILEEESGEEGEEEDEAEVSREDLEAMNLTALRKLARSDFEMTAADYKGMDKDALIDAMLGESDEEEEPEDDEDFEGYTEDELSEMSLAELKEIASEWELTVKAGAKKAGLIKLILEAQEEGDEDEDEDEDDE